MSIRLRLLAFGLLTVALSASALDAVPKRPVDLSGNWNLNVALSDDAQHLLAERQREEREQYLKWRRQREKMYPRDALPPIDIDASGPTRRNEPNPSQRASMKRLQENLYKMLAVSNTLTIRQDGSTIDLVSAVESRRVVAGSRTQVSMPEGELADSRVGWDGQWFVIDRDVRSGPHVVEKFRLLPKTGQLEYQMKWSGDSGLRGMMIHRVFDRSTQPPPPPADPADPAAGPSK